jgi:hypothetical protein
VARGLLNNVLKFPAAELHDLIRLVEQAEFDSVFRLLVFALDNRLSTKPIVELLGTGLLVEMIERSRKTFGTRSKEDGALGPTLQ